MKRRIIASVMSAVMLFGTFLTTNVPMIAKADATNVVTLGKDLTKEERDKIIKYFNVDESQVEIVEVTNAEERKYLEGIATEKEIGKKTLSCAYIEPVKNGQGINVKTANITWLTADMVANSLITVGMTDCNVVVAAPKPVSGTGALTGIMKAFEKVSDKEVTDEQKKLASKELYETGKLGEDIKDKDKAAAIMAETKANVIAKDVKPEDKEEIKKIVDDVMKKYDVKLDDKQQDNVTDVMSGVAKQDIDYNKVAPSLGNITDNLADKLKIDINVDGLKNSLSKVKDKSKKGSDDGFFASIGEFFKKIGQGIANFFKAIGDFFSGLFGGDTSDKKKDDSKKDDSKKDDTKKDDTKKDDTKKDESSGILNKTNDDALGSGAKIDSTTEGTISEGSKSDTNSADTGIPEGQSSHVDTSKE